MGEEMWGDGVNEADEVDEADEATEVLEPEWVPIANIAHENDLARELWEWIGSPVPPVSEFETHRTVGRKGPFYIELRCHKCRRQCVLAGQGPRRI